jgi:hypothetical protein
MHPIAKVALVAPVLGYGWIAAASAIYCAGTGKLNLLRFPFVQWAEAAPWWRLNGTMTLWDPTLRSFHHCCCSCAAPAWSAFGRRGLRSMAKPAGPAGSR